MNYKMVNGYLRCLDGKASWCAKGMENNLEIICNKWCVAFELNIGEGEISAFLHCCKRKIIIESAE